MLKEQAEYLRHQCFSGSDGVLYCVLRMVKWAEKNCQVEEIPVASLLCEFTDPGNSSDEPDGSPEFIERAMACEDYPILIQKSVNKLSVADGRHRLWKAFMLGQKTISAYVIPVEDMPIEALFVADDDFEDALGDNLDSFSSSDDIDVL